MQHDLAIFIGRFQPFHLGHLHAIEEGLKIAKKVLILIGDTGGPRGLKNPWTFEERMQMILDSLGTYQRERVMFDVAYDMPSNTEWAAQIQSCASVFNVANEKTVLIGHEKDASSFYLKMFPQWKHIDTGFEELESGLLRKYNATDIRKMVWTNTLHYATGLLHPTTLTYLVNHIKNNPAIYEEFFAEYGSIQAYRKAWAGSPFAPMFVTTDCVVIQSGHILLIKRGDRPGKGLWALPGGFLDQIESIEDGALRELKEETNIHLQDDVLRRCIIRTFVHDRAGGVSEEDRGRIITHVHVIKLADGKPLAKVKGGDDAAEARWVPLGEINYREIFSDHGKIIDRALSGV
ncbi:nicotinamide-nucleotide adenylyltransferase [Xanthomonas phage BUDD]|nr:nicotinamide-nucleotide adenylyltransferase [Xanthomonas phage BUDD]